MSKSLIKTPVVTECDKVWIEDNSTLPPRPFVATHPGIRISVTPHGHNGLTRVVVGVDQIDDFVARVLEVAAAVKKQSLDANQGSPRREGGDAGQG